MKVAPSTVSQPAPAQGVIGSSSPYDTRGRIAGSAETEKYPGGASNPIRQVAAEPVSTFSIDVDTASYANVRRFLTDGRLPPRDAVRVEELVNYFDYGYAAPATAAEPFKAYTAVTPSPWAAGKQIVHIGLQGYDIPRASQPPLNLVFLVDTSGSMTAEDKLPLAARAMNILIDQLSPRDRVSMVAYAGSAGAVLAPTSGAEKLKMRCALGALQAGGSTAGGEGLALAYALAQQNFRKDAVNRVILLTDGDFNVGVADPSKLKDFVAARPRRRFGLGNARQAVLQALVGHQRRMRAIENRRIDRPVRRYARYGICRLCHPRRDTRRLVRQHNQGCGPACPQGDACCFFKPFLASPEMRKT
jgi:Ca-activated chloride channel family protein